MRLVAYYEGERTEELCADNFGSQPLSRGEYRFDLRDLPKKRATRVDFIFAHRTDGPHNRHIAVESVALTPKTCKSGARTPTLDGKSKKSASTALKRN